MHFNLNLNTFDVVYNTFDILKSTFDVSWYHFKSFQVA